MLGEAWYSLHLHLMKKNTFKRDNQVGLCSLTDTSINRVHQSHKTADKFIIVIAP